jgi:alpha-tubulin suppressor-like RCC1 family protein
MRTTAFFSVLVFLLVPLISCSPSNTSTKKVKFTVPPIQYASAVDIGLAQQAIPRAIQFEFVQANGKKTNPIVFLDSASGSVSVDVPNDNVTYKSTVIISKSKLQETEGCTIGKVPLAFRSQSVSVSLLKAATSANLQFATAQIAGVYPASYFDTQDTHSLKSAVGNPLVTFCENKKDNLNFDNQPKKLAQILFVPFAEAELQSPFLYSPQVLPVASGSTAQKSLQPFVFANSVFFHDPSQGAIPPDLNSNGQSNVSEAEQLQSPVLYYASLPTPQEIQTQNETERFSCIVKFNDWRWQYVKKGYSLMESGTLATGKSFSSTFPKPVGYTLPRPVNDSLVQCALWTSGVAIFNSSGGVIVPSNIDSLFFNGANGQIVRENFFPGTQTTVQSALVTPSVIFKSSVVSCQTALTQPLKPNENLIYYWYRNGVLQPQFVQQNIPAGAFLKNESISCAAQVGSVFGLSALQAAPPNVVQNFIPELGSVPQLASVQFSRNTPFVECVLPNLSASTDIDGDSLNIQTAFKVENNLVQNFSSEIASNSYSTGLFQKGQTISCGQRISDGSGFSAETWSAPVAMQNALPVAPLVPSFVSSNFSKNDNFIECLLPPVGSLQDPDGDTLQIQTAFQVSGSVVQGFTLSGEKLSTALVTKGQTVSCGQRVFDGAGVSEEVWNLPVAVQNAFPVGNTVCGQTSLFALVSTSDTFVTCSSLASDPDGDAVELAIADTDSPSGAACPTVNSPISFVFTPNSVGGKCSFSVKTCEVGSGVSCSPSNTGYTLNTYALNLAIGTPTINQTCQIQFPLQENNKQNVFSYSRQASSGIPNVTNTLFASYMETSPISEDIVAGSFEASYSSDTIYFVGGLSTSVNIAAPNLTYSLQKNSVISQNANLKLPTGAFLNSSEGPSLSNPVVGCYQNCNNKTSSIKGGAEHFCSLNPAGKLACWGDNREGQLGYSEGISSNLSSEPTNGIQNYTVKAFALGEAHTCVLLSSGSVNCFGSNSAGQLGSVATGGVMPIVVNLPAPAQTIEAGKSYTCAILQGGDVYCWGRGGDSSSYFVDTAQTNSYAPIKISSFENIKMLAASQNAVCGILSATGATQVKCLGANSSGQLGRGNFDYNNTAEPLSPSLNASYIASHPTANHFCAVEPSGGVKCWGSGTGQQIGNDSNANQSTAQSVLGLTAPAVSLALGKNHTCALQENRNSFCWGTNSSGQIGNNSTTSSGSAVLASEFVGLSVSLIAAGDSSTCAVSQLSGSAQVHCLGNNNRGQVGYPNTHMLNTDSFSLTQKPIVQGETGISFVANSWRTTCFVKQNKVFCTGSNANGALGIGSLTPATSLVPIEVNATFTKIKKITSNFGNSFCLIDEVGGTNKLKCWGDTSRYQIPNSQDIFPNPILSPTDVSGDIQNIINVGMGDNFGCVLSGNVGSNNQGTVYCWGQDHSGNLGDGIQLPNPTVIPKLVPNLGSNVEKLEVGWAHVCVKLTTQEIKCWGYNSDKQIDSLQGSEVYSPTLLGLSVGIEAQDVWAGGNTTCIKSATGGLYCRGSNRASLIADGVFLPPNTSGDERVNLTRTITHGRVFDQVALSLSNMCVHFVTAGLECAGDNSFGTLGTGNVPYNGSYLSTVPFLQPVSNGSTTLGAVKNLTQISLVTNDYLGNSYFGFVNNLCYLNGEGILYCQGKARNGNFGNLSLTELDIAKPTRFVKASTLGVLPYQSADAPVCTTNLRL